MDLPLEVQAYAAEPRVAGRADEPQSVKAEVRDTGDDAGPCSVSMRGAEEQLTSGEGLEARRSLGWCLRSRQKYLPPKESMANQRPETAQGERHAVLMVDGVACVLGLELPEIPSRTDFQKDLRDLWKICKTPTVKTLTMGRLRRLKTLFKVFSQEQSGTEATELCRLPLDIYSVMKVDNHIHLAAAMTPRMLLGFIKEKFETEGDREVLPGKKLRTLVSEALQGGPRSVASSAPAPTELSLERVSEMLTVDSLRTVAGEHFYHRFDNFNDAYNPLGSGELRSVFLKSSNHLKGEYFGQLTRRTVESLERNGTYAEMRVSIYGKDPREWDELARWIKAHGLHLPGYTRRNLWMVQIPRVFGVFCKAGLVKNFDELVSNIFLPLFEVALDPSSHPDLAEVLPSIVAVDCVDDESVPDPLVVRRSQLYGDKPFPEGDEDPLRPVLWNIGENPPYSYYSYYLYANLRRFNDTAAALGRPWHLAFRPHAGEAGEVHHLATTFLLADGVNHGVNLWHSPVLQYLYYIAQVGISVSPISNNALFLKMGDSPFPFFFMRGLNVTLSTDDPLMFHTTNEPLLEEYTNARLVWNLSQVDLNEIAGNSVRQSAFPQEAREAALGREEVDGPYCWDPRRCNVPLRRLRYRRARLAEELSFIAHGPPALLEPSEPAGVQDWRRARLP